MLKPRGRTIAGLSKGQQGSWGVQRGVCERTGWSLGPSHPEGSRLSSAWGLSEDLQKTQSGHTLFGGLILTPLGRPSVQTQSPSAVTWMGGPPGPKSIAFSREKLC